MPISDEENRRFEELITTLRNPESKPKTSGSKKHVQEPKISSQRAIIFAILVCIVGLGLMVSAVAFKNTSLALASFIGMVLLVNNLLSQFLK
jgi:pheromone shutdown protein TraB